MRANHYTRTDQLVDEARRACQAADTATQGLNDVREEIAETMRFLLWWKFFDYDPRAADFLENLDLHDCPPMRE